MSTHPRLRHGTIISRSEDDRLLAMVGSQCLEIEIEEGSKDTLLELKRYLDGTYTVPEIAVRLDADEADVATVIGQLASFGLLADPDRGTTVDTEAFLAKVDDTVTMWRRQMNCHPLFGQLQTRSARVEVFHGLIIETFHFVRSAPAHIATAIAAAPGPEWRSLLADYLAEERGHERLVLQSLTALGYSEDRILAANPVIGTTSLINNLCAVARRSTLGYLCCMRLIEGQPDTLHQAIAEMRAIADRYGVPHAAIEPVIRHALIDADAGHSSLLRQALAGRVRLGADEASVAINCMHDMKHSFDQYYDQIASYYGNPSSYVPRMAIDYFCL